MKTTLLIPILNEIEGLKVIMPRIKKEWVDEILFIDGHSTDGSREYAEGLGYRVIVQTLPGGMGAWTEGFRAASGDHIILFSPDGNSIPEVVPELVAKAAEGYDMVIASRYAGTAKSDDDDWASGLGNTFFNKLVNFLYRVHYKDALVMYRIFRKGLLAELSFTEETGAQFNKYKTSLFELLVSIRCARAGMKVAEIPADEPANIGKDDSRAHPGLTKFYNGFLMLYHIAREVVLRPALPGRSPTTPL